MKKVAIIDSGSGGANVLIYLLKNFPLCNYLLYIDDKNLPYGNKTKEELVQISKNIVDDLISFFVPDIIILACNTLTSTTIDFLRQSYKNIVFLGVEPAILPALREVERDKILVLATPATKKYSKLLKPYDDITFCPKNLPKFIDENLLDRESIKAYLKTVLPKINYQAIVLGCTHFEGIREELLEVFDGVKLFGSLDGLGKHFSSFLDKSDGYIFQVMTSSGHEKDRFLAYILEKLNL